MCDVIDSAVLQVNGLSDMGGAIEQRRRHSRAPVHKFASIRWKKQGEEFPRRHAGAQSQQSRADGAAAGRGGEDQSSGEASD